jgi:hypothetical protein
MQHGMRLLVPVVFALLFATCSAEGGDEGGGSGGSTATRTGGSGAAAGRGGSSSGGGAYAEAGSPPTKLGNPSNLSTPPAVTPPFSLIDGDGNQWWLQLDQPAGF